MEQISQKSLRQANITEASEQLFVHLWCEQFNPDTIDSYRVRVMNSSSIIVELEGVIDDCIQELTPHLTNVMFVAKEAERILAHDLICQKYFKSETDFAIKYIKSLWDKPKKDELIYYFSKIILLNDILDKKYFDLLLSELENEIFVSKNIENIQSLTKSLATQLINTGFSFSYLYNRKSLFLDNTRNLPFKEKFNYLKNDLNKPSREFKVVFKFSAIKNLLKFKTLFLINIYDKFVPLQDSVEESRFDTQSGELYGEIKINSPDPFSAVYSAIKSINIFQNIARYEYRSNEFKISPSFLVYDDSNGKLYLIPSNQRHLGFIGRGKDQRFEQYLNSFNHLLDSTKNTLDKDGTDRILNSFHYFRLSQDSVEPETRFLHNWIALEYLVKINSNKGLIDKIVSYVPKLLVTQYLSKLLKDFAANLFRLRCDKVKLVSAGITKSNIYFDLASIYDALRDSAKTAILVSSTDSPLFKVRINEMAQIMKDSDSILSKLKEHLEDVEWNLQRIYRVRNKIVHSASTKLYLTNLDGNLTYYYTTLLNNVLYTCVNSPVNTSLDSVYLKFESYYEYLMMKIKENRVTSDIVSVF